MAQQIINGNHNISKDTNSIDLWKRVVLATTISPAGYFRISWIKGHLDDKENQKYMDEGIFTEKEKQWHVATDDMATQEKQKYMLPDGIRTIIGCRMLLAILTQSMCIKIWETYKRTLSLEAIAASEEQAYDHILREMEQEMEEPNMDEDPPEVEEHPKTRKQILMDKYRDYPWGIPTVHDATASMQGEENDIHIPRDVIRDINWEPVQRYYKNLLWENTDQSKGVTFAELAIDFELISGLNIRSLQKGANATLEEKAKRMKTFYKYYTKKYPQYDGPAMESRNTHLTIIGGRWFQGLEIRPHLMSRGSDEAIVYNIDNHYNKTNKPISSSLSFQPDYKGIKTDRATLDSDVIRLQRQLITTTTTATTSASLEREANAAATSSSAPARAGAAPAPTLPSGLGREADAIASTTTVRRRYSHKQRPRG